MIVRGASLAASVLTATLFVVACGEDSSTNKTAAASSQAAVTPPAPPARDVRSAGGYRIVGSPVAGVVTTGNGITVADVTVRTNQALPRRDGSVAANIRLDGSSGASPPIRIGQSTARNCYNRPVDEYSRAAKTGDRTVMTIRIPGVRRQLRMTLKFADPKVARKRIKKLCGAARILDRPDTGY